MKAATTATVFTIIWALSSPVVATHEADHRFTVEGFVCGPKGEPIEKQLVVVKDTRTFVRDTVYTDSSGYYKAVLHLHNDNLGDPVLVIAGDREQRTQVQFDPEDRTTERITRIDFGAGCETQGGGAQWLYYSVGATATLAAAYAGARIIRKRRKSRRKGKGPRK